MKIAKRLLIIFFSLFISSTTIATDMHMSLVTCDKNIPFFPYKAARQAENKSLDAHAFELYCVLAYKGDYRAQYKVASYLSNGIPNHLEIDLVQAYGWAKLSHSQIKSRKRSQLTDSIEASLTQAQKTEGNLLFRVLSKNLYANNRVDVEYKPINLKKYLKTKEVLFTGSRIKRKKDNPPNNLKTYH